MASIICMESHRNRKAATRGFREWRRIFRSIMDFDENTRWADLPNKAILFFCEEGPESKHAFYDLLMSAHHSGTGHDFESQPYERLSILMNAYFFITDQARFECMRRLGWLESIPRGDKPIIEVVMESGSYDYAALFETPVPTRSHPAYVEDCRSRGMDRPALVRRHIPEAVELFKERLQVESSATV